MFTFKLLDGNKTINITLMEDRYPKAATKKLSPKEKIRHYIASPLKLVMFQNDPALGSQQYATLTAENDITATNDRLDNQHAYVLEGDHDRTIIMDSLWSRGVAYPTSKTVPSEDGTKKYRLWRFNSEKLGHYCSKSKQLQKVEMDIFIDLQVNLLKDMQVYKGPETGVLIRKKLSDTCSNKRQVERAVYGMKFAEETVEEFLAKGGE